MPVMRARSRAALVRPSPHSRGFAKQFPEQLFCLRSALFGQPDRFVLAHRVLEITFLVQAIVRIPIVTLPGSSAESLVAPREMEQSENGAINLVRINFHSAFVLSEVALA